LWYSPLVLLVTDFLLSRCSRQAKIAKYLRSNQKDLALSHLRSKKALEDVLSKRTLAYENVHSVLLKIESAESDVAILSAYSSATATLKSLLSHPSLQRDNVENTMEALQDVLADQKEIEDVITEGGKQAAGLDDAEEEIQAELKELEAEARREKEKADLEEKHRKEEAAKESKLSASPSLPSVPDAGQQPERSESLEAQ
jgi:charged multivesicular body protein 7